MPQKLIDIFRVYYNWVEPRPFRIGNDYAPEETEFSGTTANIIDGMRKGRKRYASKADRTTPAMRLGLAKAPVDLKDVLYRDYG